MLIRNRRRTRVRAKNSCGLRAKSSKDKLRGTVLERDQNVRLPVTNESVFGFAAGDASLAPGMVDKYMSSLSETVLR